MDFSNSIIALLLVLLVCPVYSSEISSHHVTNQTFRSVGDFHKLKKTIATHLRQINKLGVKTIKSLDGDIIDCISIDRQLAFDHPLLKGQKPLNPPERPRDHNQTYSLNDNFQLWSLSNETCPEKTVPIKRTTEEDMLRANSIYRFGRKLNSVKRDNIGEGHVHATAYVSGVFYGAKANLNVWKPQVANTKETSLSQIWITAGPYESVNTIEVGWSVDPGFYGDSLPRLFIYWTADGYHRTGCYNYQCSGFVQTSNTLVMGSSISPISTYNGQQFDITLNIWKAPSGDWWLEYGTHGTLIGYWPSSLFTHLKDHATNIQFGGEIFDSKSTGFHTTTQMGSGHYADEGSNKASYIRNMQVLTPESDNKLIPLSNPKYLAEQPNCYNIQGGVNNEWGNYFYYGGPGRNEKCP